MQRSLLILSVLIQIATENGVCQAPEKIANDYFIELNYEMALPIYERLFSSDTTKVEYVYRLGVCHLMLNYDKAKAIPFLEKASTMPGVPTYVWLDLGSAYRFIGQLKKAEECLNKFISITKNKEEREYAQMLLKQLGNAPTLLANPVNVEFVNLGSEINSPQDDFMPYVDKKNTWMFFNSRRIFSKELESSIVNVHFATYRRNRWRKAGRAPVVNSAEDNYVVGKNADDNILFIKPQRYEVYDDILVATLNKENINGKPTPLPSPINTKDVESGATISITGDTLIFASNRKGGFGGLDLYISIKLPDGSWGVPVNLGSTINTPYDEDFPMFSNDGKKLYFASQGHTSMGGFDLFVSSLNSDGTWTTPKNLGYPINNFYDNYTICFSQNDRYAYVADVRPEGLGGYDIYKIIFSDKEADPFLILGTVRKGPKTAPEAPTIDDNIRISVYKTDRVTLVGIYAFNYNTSRFVAALYPGKYFLKIEADKYKTIEYEFEVQEVISSEMIELDPFILE